MNVHHLELFYYVARFGGISEAVRNMPYGIQQPAISAQISQLEEYLGVTLFQRRPFALSAQGQDLFHFVSPFFGNLQGVADRLRGGIAHHVRIGASEIVLRDHLPSVLECLKAKLPDLRVSLRNGYQPELEAWLLNNELDIAITIIDHKCPAGLQAERLLTMPMVFLVEKSSKIKTAADLWKRDHLTETLISLPANELMVRVFFQKLRQMAVDWFIGMEVSSLALVESYVANGYGIGLSVAAPGQKLSPKIRVIPLDDFPPLNLAVFWRGTLTPVLQVCVEEIRRRAAAVAAFVSAHPAG